MESVAGIERFRLFVFRIGDDEDGWDFSRQRPVHGIVKQLGSEPLTVHRCGNGKTPEQGGSQPFITGQPFALAWAEFGNLRGLDRLGRERVKSQHSGRIAGFGQNPAPRRMTPDVLSGLLAKIPVQRLHPAVKPRPVVNRRVERKDGHLRVL